MQTRSIRYMAIGLSHSITSSLPTDRKFTGHRQDSTGLYYYGARYYDPEIGRFISPDTVVQNPANPQSFNRYSYCMNNPLRYLDPNGHYYYDYYSYMTAAAAEVIQYQADTEAAIAGGQEVSISASENAAWAAINAVLCAEAATVQSDQVLYDLPVSNYVPVSGHNAEPTKPIDGVTIACDIVTLIGDIVFFAGTLCVNPEIMILGYGISVLGSTAGFVYSTTKWNEGDATLKSVIVTYADTLGGLIPNNLGLGFSIHQLVYDLVNE